MNSVQCELISNTIDGLLITVTWLPDKFAIKNKSIIIDDFQWTVNKIYNKMPYKYINERSQDFKHQRKVSDI